MAEPDPFRAIAGVIADFRTGQAGVGPIVAAPPIARTDGAAGPKPPFFVHGEGKVNIADGQDFGVEVAAVVLKMASELELEMVWQDKKPGFITMQPLEDRVEED